MRTRQKRAVGAVGRARRKVRPRTAERPERAVGPMGKLPVSYGAT